MSDVIGAINLDIKVLIRALLSPFIGHRIAKDWNTAVKKSAGWSSAKTLEHERRFQYSELMNQITSDVVLDERFFQIAAAFLSTKKHEQYWETKKISVLDVGGGYGKYFFLFNKFFPNFSWQWTVVETASQCDAMPIELKSNPGIRFCSEIPRGEKFDIGLMSSVIEYVEKPFELLATVALQCEEIVLNRIPLSPFKKNYIAIQRPGFFESRGSYPLHLFSEKIFLDRLKEYGTVTLRWLVPQDSPVVRFKHFPEQGLVFQPRHSSSV